MSAEDAGAGALFVVLFLGFALVGIGSFVFWILKLVEVVRIPDHQYPAAGTEKVTWILVVVLAGVVGALVWQFAKRSAVLAAAGRVYSAPPGWFPEHGTGTLRWWDGVRWTEHRLGPPASH